jgi:RNA polymerase sigma-70 factor (ECF subfamily)
MTPKLPRRHGFFEHYEALVGTWTRRLRNRQLAEDLAHDTFVRGLESDSALVAQRSGVFAPDRATSRWMVIGGRIGGAPRSRRVDHSVSSSGDPEHFMQAIQLADSIEAVMT